MRRQQVGLLGRQVDHDQSVHTRRGGIDAEALRSVGQDRVEIAHQYDRGGIIVGAEIAHHRQGARDGSAGAQRAQAGGLDDRAVRHRVGERHADLDQVGARAGHAAQDGHGGGGIGVPCLEEGDQRATVLGAQLGETGGNAAHAIGPITS